MEKDHKEGLPYKLAVLRDRDGDLKKAWYVVENSVKLTTPFQFKLTTCSG
nr:hypothetical protein [uncultured Dyadobacter sp.]